MERRPPTPAERYAAIGGIVLFAGLFFHWYGYDAVVHGVGVDLSVTGWSATSFLRFFIVLVAVAAVGFPVARLIGELPQMRVSPGLILLLGGGIVLVWILYRMFSQPRGDESVEFGIFVSLVGAILVTVGAFQTLEEEGTSVGAELRRLVGGGE